MVNWHNLSRSIVQTAVDHLPKRRHAVVAGFPDDEGNSVEVVRALAEDGREPVYWLIDGRASELMWLLNGARGADRVRLVRKRSLRAFVLYATARTVFFTHGLFSCPRPPRKAVFVNLWHGDGPKRTANPNFAPNVPSTFVVSGTRLWGLDKARSFGVREDRLLVTGNPRIDQFQRPASDGAMRSLGLDPERPLILWMPTYRGTRGKGIRQWRDALSLESRKDVQSFIGEVAQRAETAGVSLVIKPHPLDIDEFERTGARTLSGSQLLRSQVGVYQLLARAAGLITDYSSVWTDYIVLDRPIGFYCPDLPEYEAGRGLNVRNLTALLPGPLLNSADEFNGFVEACASDPTAFQEARKESVRRIGAEIRVGATRRLLERLRAVSVPADAERDQLVT